jgi:hypothetical protein
MSKKSVPIIGFYLMTGDQILGKSVKIEGGWVIKDPASIIPIRGETGPAVGLSDFMPFTETKIMRIIDDKILFTFPPDNEMAKGYMSRFEEEKINKIENVIPFTRR